MDQVSPDVDVRARKIVSTVLRRVHRDNTQQALAVAMGVSGATLSRLLSEHLENVAKLLVHAGLKVVPEDHNNVPVEYVAALTELARRHLSTVDARREGDVE